MATLKRKNPIILGTMFIFLLSSFSLSAVEGKEKTGKEGEKEKIQKVQKAQANETVIEQVFTQDIFEKLPKGRDFLSIAPLVPGVNNELLLGGISINGASGAENRYYIDGVDTTTQYTGESGLRVNFDFIEEVRVQSAGISAENPGSTGGVIQVKIRDGGNEFHGAALFYYNGSALTGQPRDTLRKNPLDGNKAEYVVYPKDKWNAVEPGFSLGGPIIKDKLWFFGSFMPRFKTTTRNGNNWPVPNWVAGGSVSTIFGGVTHFSGSNIFTRKDTYFAGLLKITGQPFKNFRFSLYGLLDYHKWKGELPPVEGSREPNRDYAPIAYELPKISIGGSVDYILSDRLSLFLTGGYYRSNEKELLTPDLPFKMHMTSNAEIPGIPPEFVAPHWSNGVTFAAPQLSKNIQDRLSGTFDLTYDFNLMGSHYVKLGFQAVRSGIDKDAGIPISYKKFHWLLPFVYLNGVTIPTTMGFIEVIDPWGIEAKVHSTRWSLYFQDSWTIGDKLTL
ncbi:MAG TPA: TonB-dependent receptor plug domain-containing protein, partial [Candidatus Kapabacteria bacterium]|nr:TonB-dependent receptor plug domain-containing protein [Candidatus Kapabacteria bacterium]